MDHMAPISSGAEPFCATTAGSFGHGVVLAGEGTRCTCQGGVGARLQVLACLTDTKSNMFEEVLRPRERSCPPAKGLSDEVPQVTDGP